MAGYATITAGDIPAPAPPDGWDFNGYDVSFDVVPDIVARGMTIGECVKEIEHKLADCLHVVAFCRRQGSDGDGPWEEQQECYYRLGKCSPWRKA